MPRQTNKRSTGGSNVFFVRSEININTAQHMNKNFSDTLKRADQLIN